MLRGLGVRGGPGMGDGVARGVRDRRRGLGARRGASSPTASSRAWSTRAWWSPRSRPRRRSAARWRWSRTATRITIDAESRHHRARRAGGRTRCAAHAACSCKRSAFGRRLACDLRTLGAAAQQRRSVGASVVASVTQSAMRDGNPCHSSELFTDCWLSSSAAFAESEARPLAKLPQEIEFAAATDHCGTFGDPTNSGSGAINVG